MDETTRRAYLEAMGVPIWVERGAAAATPADPPDAAAAQAGESTPMEIAAADDATTGSGPTSPGPTNSGSMDPGFRDLARLHAAVRGCTACGLCETRTQAVPGVGNEQADLLVVGEAPGRDEDRQGEPFVGRAGRLLDRMLAAIALDRQTVYITNVLKCRPPNNRDPRPEEVAACTPYLLRQIELVAPKIILVVGRVPAQYLLATDRTIGRLRGQWHAWGPDSIPLRVTYHPAYLLRNPAAKRKEWEDLKAVRAGLRDGVDAG